jgi:hypothetical protein
MKMTMGDLQERILNCQKCRNAEREKYSPWLLARARKMTRAVQLLYEHKSEGEADQECHGCVRQDVKPSVPEIVELGQNRHG